MKMKRKAALVALVLGVVMVPASLAGCGVSTEETQKAIVGTWVMTEEIFDGRESLVMEGTASVHFEEGISEQRKAEIGEEIKKLDNVKSCVYYSRDDRIRQYAEMTGVAKTEFRNWDISEEYEITFQDILQHEKTMREIEKFNGVWFVEPNISGYVFDVNGTLCELGQDGRDGTYIVTGNKILAEFDGNSTKLKYGDGKLVQDEILNDEFLLHCVYEKQ